MLFEFGIFIVEYMRATRARVEFIKTKKDIQKIHQNQVQAADWVEKLNEIFWFSLFIQYLTIALAVCILGYQLLEVAIFYS